MLNKLYVIYKDTRFIIEKRHTLTHRRIYIHESLGLTHDNFLKITDHEEAWKCINGSGRC